jgi:ABC-2 type transport system ATP-binding protein
VTASLVEVCGLQKCYGKHQAVVDISFTIGAGEIFGLLGPNGAGKSTTMGMMAGIITPTAGKTCLGGYDVIRQKHQAKQLLGWVPQDLALYSTLSAADNLMFWGQLYGLQGKHLEKQVGRVLEFVGLTGREREAVETFSGGMKRRLNLAVALLHEPQVLLLDEPTVGVDPQSRNYLFESLKQLSAQGVAILYTSHYMEEVERLCHQVAIMESGKILIQGTPQQLCAQLARGCLDITLCGGALDLQQISEIPGVKQASYTAPHLHLEVEHPQQVLPEILHCLSASSLVVRSLALQETTLETVFLQLTGRALRD